MCYVAYVLKWLTLKCTWRWMIFITLIRCVVFMNNNHTLNGCIRKDEEKLSQTETNCWKIWKTTKNKCLTATISNQHADFSLHFRVFFVIFSSFFIQLTIRCDREPCIWKRSKPTTKVNQTEIKNYHQTKNRILHWKSRVNRFQFIAGWYLVMTW